MIRRPPRSTLSSSSAASDVYKRQVSTQSTGIGEMAEWACCGRSTGKWFRMKNANHNMIQSSEMLLLSMTEPAAIEFQQRALASVGDLLIMVALELGLEQQDGATLKLFFCNIEVMDHRLTLDAVGLCQAAEFKVRGVEAAKAAFESRRAEIAQEVNVHQAAMSGQVEHISAICQLRPERVHERDWAGNTPLHCAAHHHDANITRLLLEANADPNATDKVRNA
eukprot:TRINITY_DN8231_c0_g1_i3.p1 TRINITY_DN8231_c0_g1~~TRINITY_DN8231_c0_g1_i3.p1  ORF type:complete len:223 (-),score=37.67 TRINITY_DN8231_c0_g1_i3:293-961(-)